MTSAPTEPAFAMRNNFDALRLLAAAAVLCSHQFLVTGRPQPMVGPLDLGNWAVLVFFSISGYLVASSWAADPHVLRFFAKRLLRVWPAYAVFIVISSIVVWWVDSDPPFSNLAAGMYLRNLLFWRFEWVFFPSNPFHNLNGSLWTIPLEVACYAVFGSICALCGRFARPVILGMGFIALVWFVAAGAQEAYGSSVRARTVALPFFGAYFAAGALIFQWAPSSRSLLLIAASSIAPFLLGEWVLGALMLVPASVILIGTSSWIGFRTVGQRGDYSYGIYIWAFAVQQLGVLWLGRQAPFMLLLAISVLGSAALALLSWHFVERPTLQWKPTRP